jgi:hypothetical protein
MFGAVVVALVTLWLAYKGKWFALALPLLVVLFGLVLYLAGEPATSGGGDGDPMRLAGTAMLAFGVPWTAVAGLVFVCARWWRRAKEPGQDHGSVSTEARR